MKDKLMKDKLMKEFYQLVENETWTIICPDCNKPVECKPHYRDKPDENNYGVCPICNKKLYVNE